MTKTAPIGIRCHPVQMDDGSFAVLSRERGPGLRQNGPYFSRGGITVESSPSGDVVRSARTEPAAETTTRLIGVTSREILYFWLSEERLNGAFNAGSAYLPTVGGAYPSCINLTDYPSGVFTSVDPSTVFTDASYGWTVPDSTLAPYYLTNGASIWVEGDVGLGPTQGSPGYVDLPDREVLAVGSMRTLSQTIGADDYEWDVYDILVREYKYKTYTWAQWWAI